MSTHEKALEAAAYAIAEIVAARRADGKPAVQDQRRQEATAAISAYLSALTPPDVAGLVERYAADYDYRSDNGGGYTPTEGERAMLVDFGHGLLSESTLTHLAAENALLREREGWKDISSAPKDKTRVILAWTTPENLPPHIELGYWSDIKASWVNTYGNPFSGSPDIWFTPPFPASPSHQEQRNG